MLKNNLVFRNAFVRLEGAMLTAQLGFSSSAEGLKTSYGTNEQCQPEGGPVYFAPRAFQNNNFSRIQVNRSSYVAEEARLGMASRR